MSVNSENRLQLGFLRYKYGLLLRAWERVFAHTKKNIVLKKDYISRGVQGKFEEKKYILI